MYVLLSILILVVSLAAYAGVATLHEFISDHRYVSPTIESVSMPVVRMGVPKSAAVRRTGGGSYVKRQALR